MPNERAEYWEGVAAAKAPPLAPRKIYCYEQCSREESRCREESVAGPLNWYLIHLPDNTIAKWLEPQERLPRGAEYVRPVGGASLNEALKRIAIANCEADIAEGKYDNWQPRPKPPLGKVSE